MAWLIKDSKISMLDAHGVRYFSLAFEKGQNETQGLSQELCK